MIRAVLDSNVIVSGVIRQEGPPGQVLKAALVTGKVTLVTSPFLLQEVAESQPDGPLAEQLPAYGLLQSKAKSS